MPISHKCSEGGKVMLGMIFPQKSAGAVADKQAQLFFVCSGGWNGGLLSGS
jgi:hypothetical protein